MNSHDFDRFESAFVGAWEFHREVSPNAVAIAFRVLAVYPLADVLSGIDGHIRDPQRGQYPPKPADIVYQIERSNQAQYPSADEAWALCPADEDETVVWTEEAAAAYALANRVDARDSFGRRSAFRSAYDRLVSESRATGRQPQWTVSLGHDPQRRDVVIRSAVECGRLTADDARAYLGRTETAGGMALLTHAAATKATPESHAALDALAKLKANLGALVNEARKTDEGEVARRRSAANALCERLESEGGAAVFDVPDDAPRKRTRKAAKRAH